MAYSKFRVLCFVLFVLSNPFKNSKSLFAQESIAPSPSHYVFSQFKIGLVKMKSGANEQAVMNYNKLSEEMIFEKNGVMMALDRMNDIDTVIIDTRKFVPYGKCFLELTYVAAISLYRENKCNVLVAGHPSGYGGMTETAAQTSVSSVNSLGGRYQLKLPGDYHITDASLNWIQKDGSFHKANSKSQILKIFPEKSKEIKDFIKKNNLDVKKFNDLISIVEKCNELYKK